MKPELILLGGGGHCRSCIDVIEQEGKWQIAGIVDLMAKVGQSVLGYPIIASDADLGELTRKFRFFLITIGQITDHRVRVEQYLRLKEFAADLPIVVSPRAYVSPHARVGEGTIILHGATVNAGAEIGANCIINSHALVEHDAMIAFHCHISTGAIVNGGTQVQARTFVGSQAVLREGIEIGEGSVIGAGMRITRSLGPGSFIVSDRPGQ
jgi:sugar O-acyltransferase (sialic acid O-acetyltransferase NeuD family)